MNEVALREYTYTCPEKLIYHRARRKYYLQPPYSESYLTQREAECVFWVMEGLTNKEIADKMDLSSRTIEYYLRNVRVKLNCYSKAHLIKMLKDAPILALIRQQVQDEEPIPNKTN